MGKDIFLGIPLLEGSSPVVELMIGAVSGSADFVVESQTGEVIHRSTVTSIETVRIPHIQYMVDSSGFVDRIKGIRVRVTGENPIYALTISRFKGPTEYSSWLVHSNQDFQSQGSYEYYAISTDYNGEPDKFSNILLVGTEDDTTLSITPTQTVSLPKDAQGASTLLEMTASTIHTVTLNRLQTLGFSSLRDLTGTRIVSNKPLTVITGHQCGQVPVTPDSCKPLYVHVPPTSNWGQEFLLAPFAGRTALQYYKLVTSASSTTVTYRCGTGSRQSMEIPIASSTLLSLGTPSYCYLTATSPVFVVQLAPGKDADSRGDAAVATVSPTTGHVERASFVVLPSNFPTNFITVTVQAEHFDVSQIQLDGSRLGCSWNAIRNTDSDSIVGYGCTSSMSVGAHTLLHSGETGVLSVVVYGWNNQPSLGYAYLPRLDLEVAEQQTGRFCLQIISDS